MPSTLAPHVSPPPPDRAGGSTQTSVAHRGGCAARGCVHAFVGCYERTTRHAYFHAVDPGQSGPVTGVSSRTANGPGPRSPTRLFFFRQYRCLMSKTLTSGRVHLGPLRSSKHPPQTLGHRPPSRTALAPQRSSRGNPIRAGTLPHPSRQCPAVNQHRCPHT